MPPLPAGTPHDGKNGKGRPFRPSAVPPETGNARAFRHTALRRAYRTEGRQTGAATHRRMTGAVVPTRNT